MRDGKTNAKAAGARDPNRAALATAIAERDEMDRRLEAASSAAERVGEALRDAEARLGAARSTAAIARDAHAERLFTGATAVMDHPMPSAAPARHAAQGMRSTTASRACRRSLAPENPGGAIGSASQSGGSGAIGPAHPSKKHLRSDPRPASRTVGWERVRGFN